MAAGFALFCNVFYPPVSSVVPDFHRHLRKFIQIQQKVHDGNREVQRESRDETDGHDDGPHIDGVAKQSEPGVTTGAEYTADHGSAKRLSNHIVRADKQHELQVFMRLRAERSGKLQDKRDAGKQDQTGAGTGNQ